MILKWCYLRSKIKIVMVRFFFFKEEFFLYDVDDNKSS